MDSYLLPTLAVLGPGDASPDEERVAEKVGAIAARCGWVVVSGGGPGVMEAACRGAVEAGGMTVGILPSAGPLHGYPNRWVRIPVYTGAGMARNAFNVLSARLCVAIGGASGTLSEVALAMKAGVPVWCWESWNIDPPRNTGFAMPVVFDTEDELLEELERELTKTGEEVSSSEI
jgi:uncharacterized protein (TIGR00725 family)